MEIIAIILAVVFVGLSVADTVLTIYGTSHLGLIETNRFLRPLFEGRHYAALWIIQVVGCAGILGACYFGISSGQELGRIVGFAFLVSVNVARGRVVYHNIALHNRVRQGGTT